MTADEWRWWPGGQQVVQVLSEQNLFGEASIDIYAPSDGRVHTLDPAELGDLDAHRWTSRELGTRALALRILSEAQGGRPVAAGTRVDLLPHQVAILQRALRMSPVRLAICCEVGLGKTTTAGAIVTELLARARIRRVLVVAPKGVQLQWVAEMQEKFGLDFTRIGPEGVPIEAGAAVWKAFDLAVTSIDAVKPLRRRTGWSREQLETYNVARVQGVTSAGWDLVIIDEAHHVAGSSVDVARHQLALALAESVEHLLLLTATPHSGKSESFRRFLGLLDERFRFGRELSSATVAEVVARSDKRTAIDNAGRPLFHARTTKLEVVFWDEHPLHHELYEAVTDYVREGYLSARAVGDTARGFLMLLFQRLVASSTAAIVSALDRRLASLALWEGGDAEQLGWDELDEVEADLLLRGSRPTLSADLQDLERLIDLARRTLSAETDPKTVHFLRLLRRLQRQENNAKVKVLVFTQFRATQRSIARVLEAQWVPTVTVDGTMGLAERAEAQASFKGDAQVLVSTDAGGEGVNLQFAHVVVNWDLPWAPTLLEQRIGRVDRIGQEVPVRAFNFALQDSVDQRVLEVLEAKLDVILHEMGIDKRGDVLASVDALTDELYVAAIVNPTELAAAGDEFLSAARRDLDESAAERELLSTLAVAPPRTPPSVVPRLVQRLDEWTSGSANALLRRNSLVVAGEPVPALELGCESGWLAVARLGHGDNSGSLGSLALFQSDQGRADPRRGRLLLEEIVDAQLDEDVAVTKLPIEVHDLLVSALTDFSYQHLRELGGGSVPKAPSLRLSLVVRCR